MKRWCTEIEIGANKRGWWTNLQSIAEVILAEESLNPAAEELLVRIFASSPPQSGWLPSAFDKE